MKLEDLDLGEMTIEDIQMSVMMYELYTDCEDLWYSDRFSYVFKQNLPGKHTYKTFVTALKELFREYNARMDETSSK